MSIGEHDLEGTGLPMAPDAFAIAMGTLQPDESEQALIDFARDREMVAMRHPKTGQLYAFDARTAPDWAEGGINLAFVTARDAGGNILPTRENPFGENIDGLAIFLRP